MNGPRLGRDGAYRLAAGESVSLALSIRDAEGALVDLTGRAFRWRVLSAAGEEAATSVGEVTGTTASFALPGSTTVELVGTGLRHEVVELVAAGRVEWLSGLFVAREGGPFIAGTGAGGIDAAVVDNRGAAVVQAVGAPGVTPWGARDQTLAEWEAERITGPVAAVVADAEAVTATTEAARAETIAATGNAVAATADAREVVDAGAEVVALRDETAGLRDQSAAFAASAGVAPDGSVSLAGRVFRRLLDVVWADGGMFAVAPGRWRLAWGVRRSDGAFSVGGLLMRRVRDSIHAWALADPAGRKAIGVRWLDGKTDLDPSPATAARVGAALGIASLDQLGFDGVALGATVRADGIYFVSNVEGELRLYRQVTL